MTRPNGITARWIGVVVAACLGVYAIANSRVGNIQTDVDSCKAEIAQVKTDSTGRLARIETLIEALTKTTDRLEAKVDRLVEQ